MKAKFYVDLYPYHTHANIASMWLSATTTPSTKPEGAVRCSFEVELPEPFVDHELKQEILVQIVPEEKTNDS